MDNCFYLLKKPEKKPFYKIFAGASAGFINGLFGGGGGMIVVPLLTCFLNYEKKVAHATAILIILPISTASGALYSIFGNLSVKIAFPVLIGSVTGGVVGALFLSKTSNKTVGLIFAAVMLFAGVKTLLF